MFHKIFLIFATIISSMCFSMGDSYASISTVYTPAPKISLTGTTSEVRMDVASALFGTDFSGTYLDTMTMYMSGAFYMNGIGWALMSSGAYQVALDCGAQIIANLTAQCQFTGSGWSENIGELDFTSVRYNPTTGTLSGSVDSFAGEFSVEGILLPLLPVTLNESLANLTANHGVGLTVYNESLYGDGSWTIQLLPAKNPLFPQLRGGGTNGVFSVDLSLADTYTMRLTDPQGSSTVLTGVVVYPGGITQTLDGTSSLYIQDFCDYDSSYCPDGSTRSATRLDRVALGGTIVADGVSSYDFTLMPRDRYGNRINAGEIVIAYTGTVSAVQIPDTIDISPYSGSVDRHDALVFGGDIMTIWDMSGNWESMSIPLVGQDVSYMISSIAPTDMTENRVVLDAITYTAVDGTITTITDTTYLDFAKPYTTNITPPSSIIIGAENAFSVGFVSDTSEALNPDSMTLLTIGDGIWAEFRDIVSSPAGTAQSPDSDWFMDFSSPSSIVVPSVSASFGFTGTYAPKTPYPQIENIKYNSFIHYVVSGIDVVYEATSGQTQSAEYNATRVKILGQNNARSEYGTIGTDTKTRTDFFNTIRKNIALMSRGRTDYTGAPYTIVENTHTNVNNASFDNKKTIIVIGANITITENIDKDIDSPLAIIALADAQGNGGRIDIEPGVTDIHAGLFSERAMRTTGDNQLYIYGSLVSPNTLGDTAAGICPYYVTPCVNPSQYDLEEMRSYTGSSSPGLPATSNTATRHPGSSIIIEYDQRLQSDPPPGL